MKKQAVSLFFALALLLSYLPTQAQLETCLPTRFFGGQEVRVIGSVDAGGMPFRRQPGLSEPVEGFIPLDTVFISRGMQRCVDGRNWYGLSYSSAEGENAQNVWVMDGDGHEYWLEPVRLCSTFPGIVQIFPAYPDYPQSLNVDGFDEATNVLRFSAEYWGNSESLRERHYFELNLTTGVSTQTDYWHRDLITHDLTDQLGITEQVFGDGEDFSTVYISPDQTKILYLITNPQILNCAHGCVTQTVWIADIDGSNSIALDEIYGSISRIVWGQEGRVYLSLSPIEVFEPDFTRIVCMDGSCAGSASDLILGERSLPFMYVSETPIFSPNGEWIALTMGSDQLFIEEGTPNAGFILDSDENRYIQLPYNGGAASEIVWVDDNTVLYPVQGTRWDGEDYGVRSDFYEQDGLWEIHLDFETLTYRLGDRVGAWDEEDYLDVLSYDQTQHLVLINQNRALLYSSYLLVAVCLSRG